MGGPLKTYDAEVRQAIATLGDKIDVDAVIEVWDAALASTWHGSPVWVHGDVTADNLLVKNGKLSAVIDFGCLGVGDPSCDLVIAWTLFEGESRKSFRATLLLDDNAWVRGRGWALWKALITCSGLGINQRNLEQAWRVIDEVLADYATFFI